MNFALLWLAGLLIGITWVSIFAALATHLSRRWLRGLLLVAAVLPPLAILSEATFATALIKLRGVMEPSWFGYALSLLICFVIGAVVIIRFARAGWRVWPAAMNLVAWLAVGYIVLTQMDAESRTRCAVASNAVLTQYLAGVPAMSPPSMNAAPLYESAIAELTAHPPDAVNNPPFGLNAEFVSNDPSTQAFLAANESTVKLLRAASTRPCVFDDDLSAPTMDVNGMNVFRECANLLDLHARDALANNQPAEAIADGAAALRMGMHIGARPMLIRALVGYGISALGGAALERALPAVTKHEQLNALNLANMRPAGEAFRQALRGEERLGLSLLGDYSDTAFNGMAASAYDWDGPLSEARWSAFILRSFIQDARPYIRLLEQAQAVSVQPFYQSKKEIAAMALADPTRGPIVNILATSLSRSLEINARFAVEDDLLSVAAALTHYRIDHGGYPATLRELVPAYLAAVPTDRMNGQPLRLKRDGESAVVYSVGRDGVDDGGAEMNKDRKGDLRFQLKAAARNINP